MTRINGTLGRCQHVRRDGERCKANSMRNSPFCFFHDPSKANHRAAARRAGGIERSRRAAVLPPGAPERPLQSSGELADLLRDMINWTLRGELDFKISYSVGYLLNIYTKVLEQHQIERRLAALEAIVKQRRIEPEGVLADDPVGEATAESDREDEEPLASEGEAPEIN